MQKSLAPGVALAWVLAAMGAAGDVNPRLIFMEAEGQEGNDPLPLYRLVTDAARLKTYDGWLKNESAERALDLYARAWEAAKPGPATESTTRPTSPPYPIALVKGGNHAAVGYRLRTETGVEERPQQPYIKLDPEEWRFSTTLLHETGHVALAILAGGRELPRRELASIPHTTAALTDRVTAFDEGFAIHLETLAAHLSNDPEMRGRYRHERFDFGLGPPRQGEYFRHAADLLSYAQNIARYYEVRENNFAFAPACREPDYLRVQLEKSRDFATLRSANQLLQSEGFHASVFFALTVRGKTLPAPKTVRQRQERMLTTLATVFADGPTEPDTPYLLRFVETYVRRFPAEADEVVDILLDLGHGVFVDADAAAMWREYYLAAVRLDLAPPPLVRIETARLNWRQSVLDDPKNLYSQLGPQIRCEVPAKTVRLVALESDSPLTFDVNTAEEGILRMIPNITAGEVGRWQAGRMRRPFVDPDDFKQRCGLSGEVIAQLKF